MQSRGQHSPSTYQIRQQEQLVKHFQESLDLYILEGRSAFSYECLYYMYETHAIELKQMYRKHKNIKNVKFLS